MKRSSVSSFMSGAFLILYALPYLAGGGSIVFDDVDRDVIELAESILLLIGSAVMIVAAVFVFMDKKKRAAVAMTAAAPMLAAFYFLGYPWGSNWNSAFGEFYDHVPWYCVLYPAFISLAAALIAAALWCRGWKSIILAFASIAAEIAGTVFNFKLSDYVTAGHPSPFALLIPAAFVIAAFFTGVFSCFGENE